MALVTISFFLLLVRHLLLEAMHLFLVASDGLQPAASTYSSFLLLAATSNKTKKQLKTRHVLDPEHIDSRGKQSDSGLHFFVVRTFGSAGDWTKDEGPLKVSIEFSKKEYPWIS